MRQQTQSRRGCILVADDDRAIRETLAEVLRDEGYDVRTAANGQQALEICGAQPTPDLILLDLQMPVMDGLEFMRVKNCEKTLSRIPICVMTAARVIPTAPMSAAAYLYKPIGLAELMDVVKRYC
jgi:CheY-like chemotaxis protein